MAISSSAVLRAVRACWRGDEKLLDQYMDWGVLGDALDKMIEG